MKQIKLLLVALVLFSVCKTSFGQFTFGEKTGLNMSSLSTEGNSDLKSKIGLDIGFYAEYAINDHLSIQIPLMYTTKGARFKEDDIKYRIALSYIELQPNLIYKKTIKENTFFGSIGSYYSPYAFGYYKANKKVLGSNGDSKSQSIKMGSDTNDEYKTTDFGINLALGIDMGNDGRVGIQYELGLGDISNDNNSDVKNWSFSIFFTTPFTFGKKK